MLANEYRSELQRLKQVRPVDIPHIRGVKMLVKDRLDSHTYEPNVLRHAEYALEHPVLNDDLSSLRAESYLMAEDSLCLSDIAVESENQTSMGRDIHFLKIFKKRQNTEAKTLIYVHGGCYYGGDASDTLLPLKIMAENFQGTIYSINYGLAPENPYPEGILDALAAVNWIYNHSSNITIAGDSAGASIALSVSQLMQNLGLGRIDNHILFCPTVVQGANHDGPLFNDERISINPLQRKFLKAEYEEFKQLDRIMTKYYLNGQNVSVRSPLVSPIYADPTMFKKVTILIGEFDPFRLQSEAFAEEVGTAGGDVTYIRYGGMAHNLFNYLGTVAASEDALREALKNC